MSYISAIYPCSKEMDMAEQILHENGIRLDAHLDYSCAVFDDDSQMVATGSCFRNTLRCIAVKKDRQNEGYMTDLVTHLLTYQTEHGNTSVYVYTKPQAAPYFLDLGFYPIVEIKDSVVFLENRKNGFEKYLQKLEETRQSGRCGAVVMNANPLTNGHAMLVHQAAEEMDYVHVFVLSEDASLVPFSVRYDLVRKAFQDMKNVIIHPSGPYMISSATFPSYFFKEDADVVKGQAELDIAVFSRIAEAMNIKYRYVGNEPFSETTACYNDVMRKELPVRGIELVKVHRFEEDGKVISASIVRQYIHDRQYDAFKSIVPDCVYAYFISSESLEVRRKIEESDHLIHH